MIKVAVIGATGYAGKELVKLLVKHNEVELLYVTSHSYENENINDIYPELKNICSMELVNMHDERIFQKCDVIFTALPHGNAFEFGIKAKKYNKIIIDLGADYRLNNIETYESWYGVKHKHKHKDVESVYSISELNRKYLKGKNIIANPGCYPTASILGLAPLIKNKLIDNESIIIDAKSGVSGAGRTLSLGVHFSEINENFKAYKIGTHRHIPEIEQELNGFTKEKNVKISFTPHLVPMIRGILCTSYANLKKNVSIDEINQSFKNMYDKEYFIRLYENGEFPQVKNVTGTNFCDIGWYLDQRTNRVIVVSVIDNLIKGAAGQAIQNMNIIFDINESEGLV